MLTVVKNCVIVENVKNLIKMFTDKCDGNVLGGRQRKVPCNAFQDCYGCEW